MTGWELVVAASALLLIFAVCFLLGVHLGVERARGWWRDDAMAWRRVQRINRADLQAKDRARQTLREMRDYKWRNRQSH